MAVNVLFESKVSNLDVVFQFKEQDTNSWLYGVTH